MLRKRVAVLGRGAHTLPSSRELLNRLSLEYDIVVFSEVPVEPQWKEYFVKYKILETGKRRRRRIFAVGRLVAAVLKAHRKQPFNVLHSHSVYPTGLAALVLSKLLNIPLVVAADGGEVVRFPQMNFGDWSTFPRKFAIRTILSSADKVTALTQFHANGITRQLAPDREVTVITRGVDTDLFKPTNKPSLGSEVIFLSVGYISAVKGPELLMRVFHLVSQRINCRLIHAGADYMGGFLKDLARQLNVLSKVDFLGHVPYQDIVPLMQSAHLLLVTSVFESQAMVVAEAMACGLPVCGTRTGLIADLAGTCCSAVDEQDAVVFSQEVLKLLADERRLQQYAEEGRRWSIENSIDKTAARYSDLYKTL